MNRLRHSRTWAVLGLLLLGPLSVGLGATNASAEERKIDCKDVPATVRTAFDEAYPTAAMKACAEELHNGQTAYEIISTDGDTARDVVFAADGKLIVAEEAIPTANLPEPVQQALRKKYPSRAIALAETVRRDGTITYEIHLKPLERGGASEQIVFDASGNEMTP